MTIKEFYTANATTVSNILGTINTNIMGNKWSSVATMLVNMSKNLYIYNFEKELNPVIETFCDVSNFDIENLTSANVTNIVSFLFGPYKDKWVKLWDYIYEQEYNPIWNVDGTESIVRTFEHGKTTTNTITSDVTQKSRNAFNSATPKDTDRSSTTGSNSSVDSGCDTERVTNTRGGNIGVTSTQNMLEQELEFRKKFNYFVIVMTDVINELSLKIY